MINMIKGDGEFSFESAPPLSNTWVLVIIGAELLVALAVGIACVLLSCNLCKKLRKDDAMHSDNFNFARRGRREMNGSGRGRGSGGGGGGGGGNNNNNNEMNSTGRMNLSREDIRNVSQEPLLGGEDEEVDEEGAGLWNLFMR